MQNISSGQIVSNALWKFGETAGVQIIQLVLTIIIARLLGPNDYGTMAIVLIAINFCSIFINSGIGAYLIYLDEIRREDFHTAIIFNLLVSLFLGLLIFSLANPISAFYSKPELALLIKTMVIVLPLNSVSAIYTSYAMKLSLFKVLFKRNIVAIPISGIIGLILAYNGASVWSLVVQQISYSFLLTIIIVLSVKVRVQGTMKFEWKLLKKMSHFGGFTILSSVVAFISDNINDAMIGKRINSTQLGLYNKGIGFPNIISTVVNNVIAGVMFPAFTSFRDDKALLKSKCRRANSIISYILFPLLLGMAICARPFIQVALTDKWIGCVPIIQLSCLFFCAIPYLQTMSQAYLATGHVKIRVVGELLKMVLTIIMLLLFIKYGIVAMAASRVLVVGLMVGFTISVSSYLLDYTLKEFVLDVFKPIICSLLMCLSIYPFLLIDMAPIYILLLQIIFGGIIYYLLLNLLKVEELNIIKDMIINKYI